MLTLSLSLLSSVAMAQLSKKQVFDVISQSMKAVSECYERVLKEDPSLQGKMFVSFTIDKNGMVKRAQINQSSLQSDQLKQCVITLFKTMTFPQSDRSTKVKYPLVFKKPSKDQKDQKRDKLE